MPIKAENIAVEFKNINKLYHSYSTPRHRLLEIITGGEKNYARETKALDDVSFILPKGGRLGIVGENGSGKSTLLKILAGVLTPSSGTVEVNGRVSALLELGAGFNPELSGLENIRQFCLLHGMHQDEIENALPEIITFSELKDAINHPVKTYSSGMAVRLSFACAVYVQPDILIVDEALSVGDAYFQNKCLYKIRSMLEDGTTFIYVTHAADSIRSLCTEGLWLEHGKVRMSGSSTEVGAEYQKEVFSRMVRAGISDVTEDDASPQQKTEQKQSTHPTDKGRQKAFADRVAPLRTGSGEVLIVDIEVINEQAGETDTIPFESDALIRVYFKVIKKVKGQIAIALGVYDMNGTQVLHFNSLSHGVNAATLDEHNSYAIDFKFKCSLIPNEYGLSAGVSNMEKSVFGSSKMVVENVIDYCVGGGRFCVEHPDSVQDIDLWGLWYSECSVELVKLS